MGRREMDLAVLVDDPAVLEMGDRPAIKSVPRLELLGQYQGALGGGIDVTGQVEVAVHHVDARDRPVPASVLGISGPAHHLRRAPFPSPLVAAEDVDRVFEDWPDFETGRDDPLVRAVERGIPIGRLAEVLAVWNPDLDPLAREELRQGFAAGAGLRGSRRAEEAGGGQQGGRGWG